MRPIDGDYISDALEAELCREGDDLEDRQWAYGYAAGVSFAVRKLAEAPTLTPPNEWVNRVRELDELYTKLQIITGFTVEQLLEMFAAGYTLEKPDYSKSFEEMASLAETTPPNEPLTLEELREMDEPVWVACKPIEGGNGYWCLCQHGHIITPAGSIYDVKEIPHWVFYRRPLEGAEDGNV